MGALRPPTLLGSVRDASGEAGGWVLPSWVPARPSPCCPSGGGFPSHFSPRSPPSSGAADVCPPPHQAQGPTIQETTLFVPELGARREGSDQLSLQTPTKSTGLQMVRGSVSIPAINCFIPASIPSDVDGEPQTASPRASRCGRHGGRSKARGLRGQAPEGDTTCPPPAHLRASWMTEPHSGDGDRRVCSPQEAWGGHATDSGAVEPGLHPHAGSLAFQPEEGHRRKAWCILRGRVRGSARHLPQILVQAKGTVSGISASTGCDGKSCLPWALTTGSREGSPPGVLCVCLDAGRARAMCVCLPGVLL